VFDLPSEYDDVVVKHWSDSNTDTLNVATQLPDLEKSPFVHRPGTPFDRRPHYSDTRYKKDVHGLHSRSRSFQSHGYGDKMTASSSSFKSKRPNYRSLSEEDY